MDIERLRHFCTVAETGNISVAADKVFLSQPGLSRQIQALEEELHVQLLIRAGHQIELTPAGQILLIEARRLISEYDQTLMLIRDVRNGRLGTLRVASIIGPMQNMVLPAAAAFRQSHPGFDIRLVEEDHENVLSLVEQGHVDVGIASPMTGFDDVIRETLYICRIYALMIPTHPLAHKQYVTVEDLANERLVFSKACSSIEALRQLLFQLRLSESSVVFLSRVGQTLLAAAEADMGIAVTTDTLSLAGRNLIAIPILDRGRQLELPTVLAVHAKRQFSESEQEFIAVLRKHSVRTALPEFVPWLE